MADLRGSPDRPALRRPAAADVPGPGAGAAGRHLLHGRADGRRRRGDRAGRLRAARTLARGKARRCSSCITICARCRSTSNRSCCSTCAWSPAGPTAEVFTPENLNRTYGGRLTRARRRRRSGPPTRTQRMTSVGSAVRTNASPAWGWLALGLAIVASLAALIIWRPAYNTVIVLSGSSLLGACSGMVGSFAVLRGRALMGDASGPRRAARPRFGLPDPWAAELAWHAARRARDRTSGRWLRGGAAAAHAHQGRRRDRHRAVGLLRRRHRAQPADPATHRQRRAGRTRLVYLWKNRRHAPQRRAADRRRGGRLLACDRGALQRVQARQLRHRLCANAGLARALARPGDHGALGGHGHHRPARRWAWC